MANPISKKEIKKLVVTNYEAVRSNLKTGDLIFCSGSYFFSGLIQRFTKSVWSHVGLIYIDEKLNRVFVLESEALIGVRIAPLSKYLKDYHGKNKPYKGNIIVGRLFPEIESSLILKGISFGFDELTKPYDNWEIIRIAIRTLFKITKRTKDRKYICSELVQEIFKKAGISFNYKNTIISPNDIWSNANLKLLFKIL